ncbi:unc45b [Symbiodinium pilosum]|uniref:Unc45b protein n=1 Tax=Symbiodinium pilosum TaxID=2952 RepID=A0A812XRP3_SYMPI|nr:unc45b [Symbiodinium pilosum]
MVEAQLLRSQGNAKVKAGHLREAIELYSEALDLLESSEGARERAMILGNRCHCYMRLSRYQEARADAQSSVEADPTYTKGLYRLALCQKELSDLAGAWESATRAAALDPTSPEICALQSTIAELEGS